MVTAAAAAGASGVRAWLTARGFQGVVAHVGGRGLVDQVAQTPRASQPARTARIITGAAIMIVVFGAFVRSSEVYLKLVGLGLAASVLIDATVVAWSWYRR